MDSMGMAWKVAVGLVLLLPMTAYVVGSLVAAADEPRQHDPIIVQEPVATPDPPDKSPSGRPEPSEKPSRSPGDDDSGHGDDDPEVITPDPSDLFDDHGGDRPDDDDNSGRGSGGDDDDDNSGKGSGDD